MFLAVDTGNTHTTLALFDAAGQIRQSWRIQTMPSATADELLLQLRGLLVVADLTPANITKIGLSSVVPPLKRAWKIVAQRLSTPLVAIDELSPNPVAVKAPHPDQVGADRLANIAAATASWGVPVLVVDFGTATNIDVADSEGAFIGGVISPGVLLSAQALFDKAALLAGVSIEAPNKIIGDETENSLQAGIVTGSACMVEGLCERIKRELGAPDAPIIATGGLARTVSQETSCFTAIDPELTLRGIYLMCEAR